MLDVQEPTPSSVRLVFVVLLHIHSRLLHPFCFCCSPFPIHISNVLYPFCALSIFCVNHSSILSFLIPSVCISLLTSSFSLWWSVCLPLFRLLRNAFSELVAVQRALKDLVSSIDATFSKQFEEFHVGFEGSFGTKHVTPRSLSARFLGNLVCVEGIVTKCKSSH